MYLQKNYMEAVVKALHGVRQFSLLSPVYKQSPTQQAQRAEMPPLATTSNDPFHMIHHNFSPYCAYAERERFARESNRHRQDAVFAVRSSCVAIQPETSSANLQLIRIDSIVPTISVHVDCWTGVVVPL